MAPLPMVDCFALLGVPRRPFLDVQCLKERFIELSSNLHPDRIHHAGVGEREEASARFAELNAAWNCLSDTKERLEHLLALERGSRPTEMHEVSAETSELFLEVAAVRKHAQAFLDRREATSSPFSEPEWLPIDPRLSRVFERSTPPSNRIKHRSKPPSQR